MVSPALQPQRLPRPRAQREGMGRPETVGTRTSSLAECPPLVTRSGHGHGPQRAARAAQLRLQAPPPDSSEEPGLLDLCPQPAHPAPSSFLTPHLSCERPQSLVRLSASHPGGPQTPTSREALGSRCMCPRQPLTSLIAKSATQNTYSGRPLLQNHQSHTLQQIQRHPAPLPPPPPQGSLAQTGRGPSAAHLDPPVCSPQQPSSAQKPARLRGTPDRAPPQSSAADPSPAL